jgi:hypothetical protein
MSPMRLSLRGLAIPFVLLVGWAIAAPALGALAAVQEPVRVAGTRVSVKLPAGFEPATGVDGFRDAQTGSTLVVTEIPAPVAAVRAGMNAEALATRGLRLLSTENVRISSRDALLMSASQQRNGASLRTWMAIFGTETATVMVIAAFDESAASTMGAVLREAILTAEWNAEGIADLSAGLPFRLREGATLKVATRMSNAVLLTRGGTPPPQPLADPALIVAGSIGTAEIGDIERFATQRLMQTAQVTSISVIEGRRVDIAGSPGYEIRASARDLKTGAPLVILQTLLVRGSFYYLAQGLVGAALADEYMPEFRTVVSSLTFVE